MFKQFKKKVGMQRLHVAARESTAAGVIVAPLASIASCHTIQMCAASPSYSLSSKTCSTLGPFEGLFENHH